MAKKSLLYVYFILFTLSGFSGLIYESVWSHYLKLFLGHAAYAQVLVLIIFMGGMALGAFIAAKHCAKAKNLILLYAIAEGIIGLFGVFFHTMYLSVTEFAFNHLLVMFDSSFAINSTKWLIAALMIMPQSILLGATFPLLATGIIRKFGSEGGRHLATLYFVNSLGAAAGVLANVYYFIPSAGLPGSAVIAGMFNLVLAIVVWLFSRSDQYPQLIQAKTLLGNVNLKLFLMVAAVTGAASFIYEIVWIRMLSMVLGASTHSFEIMLSAFILGLAFGSLWIRKRINQFQNPVVALAIIQVVMGVFALLTLPMYDKSFELMVFFSHALASTDNGYVLFNIVSYFICVFIMLPTTICAGMTLPLLTHLLIKNSGNDSSVGKIYTANTLGAIVGIVLASQFLMPIMGIKNALVVGAGLDLLAGLYLFFKLGDNPQKWQKALMLTPVMVLLATVTWVSVDPMKMSSSVFRSGRYLNPYLSEVVYYVDGKTSTVTMTEVHSAEGLTLSIINNGKPDASIRFKQEGVTLKPTADEPTMILLGALPYLLKPEVKTVANIGLGSGLTAQTLLQHEQLQRLDSIEIEAAVVEGAKRFGERVDKVYSDPRSHIIIDDAKTYFVGNNQRYDVIISEPPNPWVSGVASLFSSEFYALLPRYLTSDGMLVQWMHLYELNPQLLQGIYKALRESFDYVQLYQVSDADIALVAANTPIAPLQASAFDQPNLAQYLSYIGVNNIADISARKLGSQPLLDDYLMSDRIKPNSDYFPSLDFGASKARFLKQNARTLFELHHASIMRKLHAQPKLTDLNAQLTPSPDFPFAGKYNDSQRFYQLYQTLSHGQTPQLSYDFGLYSRAYQLQNLLAGCDNPNLRQNYHSDLIKLMVVTEFDWLRPEQLRDIFTRLAQPQCLTSLSPTGQNIVHTMMAWLNEDVSALNRLTFDYLVSQPALSSAIDLKMFKFYSYTTLVLNDKGQYDQFYQKLLPKLEQDVELTMLNNRYLAQFYPEEMERFLRLFNMSRAGG